MKNMSCENAFPRIEGEEWKDYYARIPQKTVSFQCAQKNKRQLIVGAQKHIK